MRASATSTYCERAWSSRLEDPAHGEQRQSHANRKRRQQSQQQPGLEAQQQRHYLLIPGIQLLFVEVVDAARELEHVLAAREHFIPQKRVSGAAPLGGVPMKNRRQNPPIVRQFGAQRGIVL